MPTGQHKFEFVGKEPLALWIAASLLFANTVLMLLLEFGGKHSFPKPTPEIVDWYEGRSIEIQFILLAVLAAIFIIFRKDIRYVREK